MRFYQRLEIKTTSGTKESSKEMRDLLLMPILVFCKLSFGAAEFTQCDCTKDVEEGPVRCLALIPVYKWDDRRQRCVPAIYGGCGATNNNFKTYEECERITSPICCRCKHYMVKEDCYKEVQESPSCRAYIKVYKWDPNLQKCVQAIYGGCNPTLNNFKTLADCEKYARPVCKTVFTEADCAKDVQTPPICKAYMPVYKWDEEEQQCVAAIYGGCNATPNNFQTKEECETVARPVCERICDTE